MCAIVIPCPDVSSSQFFQPLNIFSAVSLSWCFLSLVCREVVVYYLFTVNSQLLILHTWAGYEAVLTTTHCRKKYLSKVKVPKTYMCIHERWKAVWQHVLAVKQEEIPFLGSTISLVICFSAVYSSRHEIPLWIRTHIQSESPWLSPCSSFHYCASGYILCAVCYTQHPV